MHVPIPIRGPLALPFRAFGITRSKMNPDICTICERSFQYVKKQRQVTANATILFADIRGFTDLSERIGAVQLSEIVSLFQDRCAQAIWAHDGIVNKQMGDGLMAIFNFPIVRKDHAGAAIMAALEIQRSCTAALNSLNLEGLPGRALGVGVGIHTGDVQIGEFSSFRSDFTAIGGVVNQAARLEIPGRRRRDPRLGGDGCPGSRSDGGGRSAFACAQGHRAAGAGEGAGQELTLLRHRTVGDLMPLVASPRVNWLWQSKRMKARGSAIAIAGGIVLHNVENRS